MRCALTMSSRASRSELSARFQNESSSRSERAGTVPLRRTEDAQCGNAISTVSPEASTSSGPSPAKLAAPTLQPYSTKARAAAAAPTPAKMPRGSAARSEARRMSSKATTATTPPPTIAAASARCATGA